MSGRQTTSQRKVNLRGYAAELGLDLEQFRHRLRSLKQFWIESTATPLAATELGATATPTFFVNGELARDLKSMELKELPNLRRTLDEKLWLTEQ
jgi:protein-disulfide isomerase